MKKAQKTIIDILCLLTFFILITAFILSISGGLKLPFLAIIIAFLVLFLINYKNQSLQLVKALLENKAVLIIIVVLSILARLAPLILNLEYLCENNLSDTGVHYFGAQQLASGGLDTKIADYEKTFPYLYPYTLFLSTFYGIFGNINVSVVLSNIILDCLSGVFVYLLLTKLHPSSRRLGLILWSINPFSIVMCWLPMNIILVNCIISAALLVGVSILDGKKLFWSALFGIIIFIGNLFRPIFTILLIALIIAMFCHNTLNMKRKVACTLLVLLFAFIPSTILNSIIKEKYDDDILGSSGGWSFFVGSNYSTSGQWSREDSDYYFGNVAPKYEKISDAQEAIKHEGFERYKQMGLLKLINHAANKLSVLFSKIYTSIYDIRHVFGVSEESLLYKLLTSLVGVFFSSLTFLAIMYIQRNSNINHSSLYLYLSILGFTAAFLIVEVMNRYSSVYFALLIPLASITLTDLVHNKRNRGKTPSR